MSGLSLTMKGFLRQLVSTTPVNFYIRIIGFCIQDDRTKFIRQALVQLMNGLTLNIAALMCRLSRIRHCNPKRESMDSHDDSIKKQDFLCI